MNIVFRPEEAKLYQETIYCDVSGELVDLQVQRQQLSTLSDL